MYLEHFEISVLKLILKNIFQPSIPIELKFNDFYFYFQGIEYTVENHKILTINMELSKFRKTQSMCTLTCNSILKGRKK